MNVYAYMPKRMPYWKLGVTGWGQVKAAHFIVTRKLLILIIASLVSTFDRRLA